MKYNDYELLDLIYDNDEVAYDIMLNKYKPIIYNKALEYYNYLKDNKCTGFTLEDFYEEGIIAFNNAVRNYDPNKGSLFYSYLLVCLSSGFNLLYRNILKLKNRPLLKYKELDFEVRDSRAVDPYDDIDNLDIYNKLDDYLDSLSQLDSAIITLRINNFKYSEISNLLDISSSHISRVVKAMREKLKFSCWQTLPSFDIIFLIFGRGSGVMRGFLDIFNHCI